MRRALADNRDFRLLWLSQAAAPSRVSAWDWMGSLALLPFGFLLVGPVGEAIGVQTTLLIGAAAALVVQSAIAVALAQEKSGTPVSVVDASA